MFLFENLPYYNKFRAPSITMVIVQLILPIAAVLGFTGIAGFSMEIAKIIFIVFIVLFLITALIHALKGKAPPV